MIVTSLSNFSTNSKDISNCIMQKAKKTTISEKTIMIAPLRKQVYNKVRAMILSLKNYSSLQNLI